MWSSTAGSFLITLCGVCCVTTDEFDLAAVSCGSSQRAVLHGLVVHIMSLLLAVPISLHAFRDCSQRLRTCAQRLSVGVWHLEAARFVMGSVSARLNRTDVFVCRSTSYCRAHHEIGACLQERCFAVYVVRGKGAQVFSCFCFEQRFTEIVTAEHLICVVVCVFLSPPMSDKYCCYDVVINSLSSCVAAEPQCESDDTTS